LALPRLALQHLPDVCRENLHDLIWRVAAKILQIIERRFHALNELEVLAVAIGPMAGEGVGKLFMILGPLFLRSSFTETEELSTGMRTG
jgi:hypothetical protein